MSEAKHTPGPWTIEDIGCGSFSIEAKRHDNGRPCVIAGRHDWPSYAETSTANGRLIASAPDLLDALEAIMEGSEYGEITQLPGKFCWKSRQTPSHAALDKARAAIAKARGEA